jgi:hypothetical protein
VSHTCKGKCGIHLVLCARIYIVKMKIRAAVLYATVCTSYCIVVNYFEMQLPFDFHNLPPTITLNLTAADSVAPPSSVEQIFPHFVLPALKGVYACCQGSSCLLPSSSPSHHFLFGSPSDAQSFQRTKSRHNPRKESCLATRAPRRLFSHYQPPYLISCH